jgi:hypothetical protein
MEKPAGFLEPASPAERGYFTIYPRFACNGYAFAVWNFKSNTAGLRPLGRYVLKRGACHEGAKTYLSTGSATSLAARGFRSMLRQAQQPEFSNSCFRRGFW